MSLFGVAELLSSTASWAIVDEGEDVCTSRGCGEGSCSVANADRKDWLTPRLISSSDYTFCGIVAQSQFGHMVFFVQTRARGPASSQAALLREGTFIRLE